MVKSRMAVVVLIAPLISVFTAAAASADMNVTGTYDISVNCKGVDTGIATKYKGTGAVLITQSGADLNVEFNGIAMNGNVIPLTEAPDDKAAGNFVSCTINKNLDYSGAYNMLTSLNFKAKNGGVTFKGLLVQGAAISANFTDVCKIKGERTNPADPTVAACP